MSDNLELRIARGEAGSEIHEQSFEVPPQPGMVVLDAVHYVQRNIDSTLACRWNCKAAKCGSCSAEVNGKPVLMCKTRIEELEPGPIYIRPLKAFPLIKDLVTDVSWNYEVNKKIPPFTAKDTKTPWRIKQDDIERLYEYRKCIECFLCQDVCHVLRNHEKQPSFFGPRFFVRLASLEMHPKDVLDRTPLLHEQAGLGLCNITKCCTEVCPEHIHITDNAIIPLKERVADRYFDPLKMLWRRLRGARAPA